MLFGEKLDRKLYLSIENVNNAMHFLLNRHKQASDLPKLIYSTCISVTIIVR